MNLTARKQLSGMALALLLATQAAAQQAPAPGVAKPPLTPEAQAVSEKGDAAPAKPAGSNSNERIVVTARRIGGVPPADPSGDFIKRMYAACAHNDKGQRVDWKKQAKASQACAVIFFGLDDETSQGAPVYAPKWLLGIEGSPEGNPDAWKIVIVGPNDEFRIHKISARDAIKPFSRSEEQEKARGFGFASTRTLTHHYSYRTVLWRAYCEHPQVSPLKGCGAGYDPAPFFYRKFVRDRYSPPELDFPSLH